MIAAFEYILTMKKRLRKKKRLGEFTEYGFAVHFQLDLPEEQAEDWLDRLVEETQARGLELGGGIGYPEGEAHFVISCLGNGSVTPEERDSWLAWLQTLPEVNLHRATELIDVWHGDFGHGND